MRPEGTERGEGLAQQEEIRRLARMLGGIARVSKDASLTGQLAGGKGAAIRQYNAILARLSALAALPEGVFAPLPEDASFDEVGVMAMQLAQCLRDDEEEERRRWKQGGGVFEASPGHVKIVGFPGNIGELGDLLREYLPEVVRTQIGCAFGEDWRERRRRGKEAHAEASGAGPSTADASAAAEAPGARGVEELRLRLQETGARMREVSARMADAGLPPEEVARLAEELADLGRRQAECARELGEAMARARQVEL